MTEAELPHTDPPAGADSAAPPGEAASTAPRERSTIRFPYADLNTALEVVRGVSKYGTACTAGQLAAELDMTAGSGPYRAKVSAAGTFGLTESVKGNGVALTDLGRQALDPVQEVEARAKAFLHVPLYNTIFLLYDGYVLPDDPALEAEMVKAGVAEKQVSKARQAFQRSADQAGFFAGGRSRLVRPSGTTVQAASSHQAAPVEAEVPAAAEPTEDVLSNALLAALFKKMLPAEGEEFSAKDRRRLFRALAVNLDVIYGEPADGDLDNDKVAELFRDKQETPRTMPVSMPQAAG